VTADTGQPESSMEKREGEMTPCKLNNSLFFFQICFSVPSFLFSHREGGGETVGDHAGRCRLCCVGATASFIAPWCNNRGGKAAGLRKRGKKA
jgi:hypothetical protein